MRWPIGLFLKHQKYVLRSKWWPHLIYFGILQAYHYSFWIWYVWNHLPNFQVNVSLYVVLHLLDYSLISCSLSKDGETYCATCSQLRCDLSLQMFPLAYINQWIQTFFCSRIWMIHSLRYSQPQCIPIHSECSPLMYPAATEKSEYHSLIHSQNTTMHQQQQFRGQNSQIILGYLVSK